MISTRVHCKKQFEYRKPELEHVHTVICCYCDRLNVMDAKRPIPQYESRPLQVAKKFVVRLSRKSGTGYLDENGTQLITDDPKRTAVAKFYSANEAMLLFAKFLIRYTPESISMNIEEVDA